MSEPGEGVTFGRCAEPLAAVHDVALLDLDGVVYVGMGAVPHAAAALDTAFAEYGMRSVFVTNNAARPPAAVAAHLVELGVRAEPADVVTSAQAGARILAERLPPGSRVLCIGGPGVPAALLERGLVPVESVDADPVALMQGFGPEVGLEGAGRGDAGHRARRPVGGHERRCDHPERARPRVGQRVHGCGAAACHRSRASRRRQAPAPADAGVRGPLRSGQADRGRRPPRHGHRGCQRDRDPVAPGAHRCHRMGRPGRRRATVPAYLPRPRPAGSAQAAAAGDRGAGRRRPGRAVRCRGGAGRDRRPRQRRPGALRVGRCPSQRCRAVAA